MSNPVRVQIIEDDDGMLRALRVNLQARGYEVEVAADGATGITMLSRNPVDLVILDLGLPDIDGVDVITGLRAWSSVPVLVLSARQGDADKVQALDAGADDYLTKPFSIEELLARMRACLRRAITVETSAPIVHTEAFTIDLQHMKAIRAGADVHLTRLEWGIVETLVRNPDRLITGRQLLTQVWGPAYVDATHYLRVYMMQVRKKLEADPSNPRHFITEAGFGYRFVP
ncbi:MAG: response regulator [Candidatus Nanopelagicales bacterium]